MNIKRKLSLLNRLNEELDSHIWDVFNKYIKLKPMRFSSPESWHLNDRYILFKGWDGCMGCYDPESLEIPIEWFIDYDGELLKHNQSIKLAQEKYIKDRDAQIELALRVKEANDKVEYERLKKKFEGWNY